MNETTGNRTFFPQLQSIRGIAAMMVVLSHIYGRRIAHSTFQTLKWEWIFGQIGVLGLTIFFCLSGFLITYLLLVEKKRNNRIDIPKFYIRRILRIWPLYLLLVITGHFILPFVLQKGIIEDFMPFDHFWLKSVMYLLMLPNYVFLIFNPMNPFVDITWTIGVEEQFYLVWPQLFKKTNHLVRICIFFILLQFLSELMLNSTLFSGEPSFTLKCLNKIIKAILWSNIGYFSIGAISAIIYFKAIHNTSKLLSLLVSKSFYIILSCMIICIIFNFPFKSLLLALCYSLYQLKVITTQQTSIFLSNSILKFTGKLSYGIYLFHCSFSVLFIQLFYKINLSFLSPLFLTILMYSCIILTTVFISFLLYKLYEEKFLKMKDKFSFV